MNVSTETLGMEPPYKRLRENDPPSEQEVMLSKFNLPVVERALRSAVRKLGPQILEDFRAVEDVKPATIGMVLTEPQAVLESIKVQEIVPRTLGIFRLGQQDPDWYDRFKAITGEAGKLSPYDQSREGTLHRDCYVRIYQALEEAFKAPEVEKLSKLLFYVDTMKVAQSDRPSYQALRALALFMMQEYIRKVDGDPKLLELDSHDALFSYSDCTIQKWPDEQLNKLCDTLCNLEAPEALKDELKQTVSETAADSLL
ncbi:MAG: hypothetical protein JSR37_05100 [Verrucomicrobia bacterium]|nr:hypothetical protein [Verrucomicrobiota bacterium]